MVDRDYIKLEYDVTARFKDGVYIGLIGSEWELDWIF